MRRVKRQNTGPEDVVQKFICQQGQPYKLHTTDLPGSPDIAFPELRKVIFVHGCYWHRHHCKKATMPARNSHLWIEKFARNKDRDRRNRRLLRKSGWRVLTIWECQLLRSTRWQMSIQRFLSQPVTK
jgi:DNA mismatch endonuclease (patch repair protein)